MGRGTAPGLEPDDICSDGIFSFGLGADEEDEDDSEEDEGLGVREEMGLPAGSLEMGLGARPEPRLGLEPLWCSEEEDEDLVLGVEADPGRGVDGALGLDTAQEAPRPGREPGLLAVGLTALSLSRRWLL